MVPEYLCEYFNQNQNIHNYKTRRKTGLYLPRVKLELGKRTFRYHGAWPFNHLPGEIKMLNTFNAFKDEARGYFFIFLRCNLSKFSIADTTRTRML